MTETLKPVEISKYYINRVAAGMRRYFQETIFTPIFNLLSEKTTVFNAKNSLEDAIRSGYVYYENGAFKTTRSTYSNAIASELEELGAVYRRGAYYIDRTKLPAVIDSAIAARAVQEEAKIAALNVLLADLAANIGKRGLDEFIEKAVEGAFKKLEVDIINSAKDKKIPTIEYHFEIPDIKVPQEKEINEWVLLDKNIEDTRAKIKENKEIVKDLKNKIKEQKKNKKNKEKSKSGDVPPPTDDNVPPPTDDNVPPPTDDNVPPPTDDNVPPPTDDNVPPPTDSTLDERSKKIAKDYIYNMKYWVSNWEAENITKMRQDVAKMVAEGATPRTLKEYFKTRWNIADRKAEFLANNESDLAASVIMATRYQEMGFTHFRWGKSATEEKRRRKLHEKYYGKIYAYNDPPVIDEHLGIKGLPRQIWNCRCYAIPVLTNSFFENRKRIENAKRNIFTKIKYSIENGKQRRNNTWRYRRYGQG